MCLTPERQIVSIRFLLSPCFFWLYKVKEKNAFQMFLFQQKKSRKLNQGWELIWLLIFGDKRFMYFTSVSYVLFSIVDWLYFNGLSTFVGYLMSNRFLQKSIYGSIKPIVGGKIREFLPFIRVLIWIWM